MGAPRIVVTRAIPKSGLELLREEKYDVVVSDKSRPLKRTELLTFVEDSDAILSLLTDKIDEAVIEAAGPHLKIIANYAVGFDNIDLQAAKKHRVLVTNTPDVMNQAVAEQTFALIMAVAKRLAEADRFTRGGKYAGWDPGLMVGVELKGKTLGIVGLGRIGAEVGHIAHRGYDMFVVYTDIKRNRAFEAATGAKYRDIETLLKTSDVVTLHVPLLPTTHHLINWQRLKQMKQDAILINTSRGPVIDERALIRALEEKEIWGAGLDVYEREPVIPEALRKLESVVLTPHMASATHEAREAMGELAAKNIIAALRGHRPPNLIKF